LADETAYQSIELGHGLAKATAAIKNKFN